MFINLVDFSSIGLPDKPPFWWPWTSFKSSLVESEVFETIIASILLFKITSEIFSISLSLISGEFLSVIGVF